MGKFSDLFLLDSSVDECSQKQAHGRAARLGYELVAVDYKIPKLERKTKIPSAPERAQGHIIQNDYLKVNGKQLKTLTRLTVTLQENAQTIALRSNSVATYDLLAVRPLTEKMFHRACTEIELDIISCDMTTKLPFYFMHHSISPALERGVHFEICYSPAIRDGSLRKNVFRNALSLVSACKGRNIIISSGSEHPMELRGPHDVANLGHLFGLSEDQAKAAVSTNCQAALTHAFTRSKTIKAVMSVQKVVDLAPEDLWMVKASLEASGVSVEQVKTEQKKIAAKRESASDDTTAEPSGTRKESKDEDLIKGSPVEPAKKKPKKR